MQESAMTRRHAASLINVFRSNPRQVLICKKKKGCFIFRILVYSVIHNTLMKCSRTS